MENKELRYKWEARIASYKSSGQTQAKWCEANQISMHQFKYWYKKISGPVSQSIHAASFTPVFVEAPASQEEFLRVQVGEASIEVRPGFNPEFLAKVVRALKMSC